MNIQELKQQPQGYINAEVQAVCQSITPRTSSKTGKAFWVCKVGDPTGPDTVELSVWTTPRFKIGDHICFSGQGIKFTTDNFGAKLSVSDKTKIEVLGQSAHHEEQEERRANGQPAVNGKANPVAPQSVGMAVKEALLILTDRLEHDDRVARLCEPTFWQSVYEVASDIIRVSLMLEHGKLALSVKERNQ